VAGLQRSDPSLLDRGFVYAVAHVRGGRGRNWWLDGRLGRKRNTFTDFIAVAHMLAARGWAAPGRIVSRGLSADGLSAVGGSWADPRRGHATGMGTGRHQTACPILGKTLAGLGFQVCAPTATRTRDLLLRRHSRSVAG
jgi:hypothetical protein